MSVLFKDVHAIMIRMHLAVKAIRDTPAFKLTHPHLNKSQLTQVSMPSSITQQQQKQEQNKCVDIIVKAPPNIVEAHIAQASNDIKGFWQMLMRCRLAMPGITWIEIYMCASAFAHTKAGK